MAAAAQSNDRPHAVSTEELCAQIQCRLDPHAVEDQASRARTRDLEDLLGRLRGVAVVYDVIRAERLGMLKFLVINISGDNAYRGEHPQELKRHVSETAHTENDNCAIRIEVGQRPFDRVVRRQRGIAQRSGFRWTQVTERNQ
jgi:hypothetical protein